MPESPSEVPLHERASSSVCNYHDVPGIRIARAGFYQWLHKPVSERDQNSDRLLNLIRDCYAASRGVYVALRVYGDLRETGESCDKHRVARLMRANRIKALGGYKAPRPIAGRPSIIAPNHLNRASTVDAPNKAWVADITYIRTWQGWLYLAVVVDLYALKVVGWSMKPSLARELALGALLMALWCPRPKERVLVHSDQGSRYGSDDWKRFYLANNLEQSMSRRGNCWDNAVAESYFNSLKKERIRKRIYKTRDLARADVFDYIEMFITEPAATVTWPALVLRPLQAPRYEAEKCLPAWGSPAARCYKY